VTAVASASLVARRPLPTPRLPGFGLSLGVTLAVVLSLVVLPLLALLVVVWRADLGHVGEVLASRRTLSAYGLSFGAAAAAAVVSAPLGPGIAGTPGPPCQKIFDTTRSSSGCARSLSQRSSSRRDVGRMGPR